MIAADPASTADATAERELVEELVLLGRPVALGVARAWSRIYPSFSDDLASDALLCLLTLARQHFADPTRLYDFVNMVRVAVGWDCRRCVERNFARKRTEARAAVRPDARSRDDQAAAVADREYAESLLAQLPPRWADVLVRAVCQGEPLGDIAAETGVTLGAVSDMVWKAIRRLRELSGVPACRGWESLSQMFGSRLRGRTAAG